MNLIKKTWKIIVVNLFIFVFLVVFFSRICPITVYDSDDWIYITQMRIPLPIWNAWNPTRILPEVLMPLCGYISAYFVYPIVGDYFYSITITAAVMLSVFVLALCFCFMKLMRNRFCLSINLSLCFEILFLIFNFLIFRNRGTSRYMFYADNMTCIFFYTISGIINAIAVLIMLQYQDFQKAYEKFSPARRGGVMVLVYFAVFSNAFHSAVTAIYCGIMLLRGLINMAKEGTLTIKAYLKNNKIYMEIAGIWIISAIFEMGGGRASSYISKGGISLSVSLKQLFTLIQAISDPFRMIAIISFGWLLFRAISCFYNKSRNEAIDLFYLLLSNLGILVGYLILLCAQVHYMSRIEASWNIWFYVIVITLLGISDFVSVYSRMKPFLIPVLIISVGLALYPNGKFLMSTVDNVDYTTCVNVGRYITDQIISADRAGQKNVVIQVPMYEDESKEWVFAGNFGQVVATALCNHGIIRDGIVVQTNHDPDLLEKLYIFDFPVS